MFVCVNMEDDVVSPKRQQTRKAKRKTSPLIKERSEKGDSKKKEKKIEKRYKEKTEK